MLKSKLRKDTIDKKTNENKTELTIRENTSNKIKSLPTNTSFKKGQKFYEKAVNELKEFLSNELISETALDTLSLFEQSQLRFSAIRYNAIHVSNNYFFKNELKEDEKQKRILYEIEIINRLKNLYSLNLAPIEKDFEDLAIKVDYDNPDNPTVSDKDRARIYPELIEISMYLEDKHDERTRLIDVIFGSENVNFRIELAAEQKYHSEHVNISSAYFDLKYC